MSTMVDPLHLDLLADPAATTDEDVRTQVWALLSVLYPQHDLTERRRENRYPFPYLVQLAPVADDAGTPQDDAVVVVGKHLSENGLGFYHPKPLPHRRMVASLETGSGQWIRFVIELNWCRFIKRGWYESGGRFLRLVQPSV